MAATPVIRREKDREQKPDDSPPDEQKPAEPQDEIVISSDGPTGFDDPDQADNYHMTLAAIYDLLDHHRTTYPLQDFSLLQDQLAFLQSHRVDSVYWPPSLTLQDAIHTACTDLTES